MPEIDPSTLNPVDAYRMMIGCVVPRPIAWVTTVADDGRHNLAPFSFFTGVTSRPPTIAIAIGPRTPPKDTLANLRSQGQAVVHLPPLELMEEVHQSGAEYRDDINEASELGLELLPSTLVVPPRLAKAEVALECQLDQEVAVGDPATALCLLRVLRVHVADAVAGADGLPDPERLRALGRLGERSYLAGTDWGITEMDKQHLEPDQRRPRPTRS
ncbi:MAG: flavin reductase family protein [Planctomycetota bacterium]|jgi:flavin reductase (DIM6/NTAB) family NADH-FMN oxidoreductase RutF